ncbi:MAG: P-loop NTPase fold protein [Nitrososphaerales archaeon]
MALDPYGADYATSLNAIGLDPSLDPFPTESPAAVDYWADNKTLLEKLLSAQADTLMFSTTKLYIFWGPYGVGKTFAVQYLSNKEVRRKILQRLSKGGAQTDYLTTTVTAIAPRRTGDLTFTLYKAIMERLVDAIAEDESLVKLLRERGSSVDSAAVGRAFANMTKSIYKTLGGDLNKQRMRESDGYRFLLLERNKLGKLQDTRDMIIALKMLVSCLLTRYQRVVISIDELDNLRTSTITEKFLFSDFVRKIHDEVDNGLTLILIFSFPSFQNVEDILQQAAATRAAEPIEFPLVTRKEDVVEYITDCMSNPDEVIEKGAVAKIAEDLLVASGKQLTFREINKEMHRIFAMAFIASGKQKSFTITSALYSQSRKEPSVIKDLMKELRETSSEH